MGKFRGNLFRFIRRAMRQAIDITAVRPAARTAKVLRDTSAVTTIEFSIIALPYFALIMGTMAVGLWYFVSCAIDLGVYTTARLFQTGQIQTGQYTVTQSGAQVPVTTAAQVSQVLCSPSVTPSYIPCSSSNPAIHMAVVSNFLDLLTPHTMTVNGQQITWYTMNTLTSSTCSPEQGDVVYIQAIYTMPIFGAVIHAFGGDQLLSGAVFRVEQFPTTSSTNFSACTVVN